MTNVFFINATSFVTKLDELRSDANNWDSEAKAGNEKLYGILAGCLEIFERVKGNHTEITELDEALEVAGRSCKKSTPVATKVIYYVFDAGRHRSYAYGRVLKTASKEKITPAGLPSWIKAKGGIEEIRIQSTGKESSRQIVESARKSLANKPALGAPFSLSKELQPGSKPGDVFSVALVRKNREGKGEIVWGLNNEAIIQQVLLAAGKALKPAEDRKAAQQRDRAARENTRNLRAKIDKKYRSTDEGSESAD